MKHLFNIFLAALVSLSGLTSIANAAAKTTEVQAIEAMAGCYEVTFEFKETKVTDPTYPVRSQDYFAKALEYITVDHSAPEFVALQHILITPNGVQKHWRQEWELEPVQMFNYVGPLHWKSSPLNPENTSGTWLQRVTQVDDSPRYDCFAKWLITDDSRFPTYPSWSCRTDSPLPRREFIQRSDYQILNRGNTHTITPEGWTHHEFNQKIKLEGETRTVIAEEQGVNTYKRVDATRCEAAKEWWSKNAPVWHQIQGMWNHIRGHHGDLQLKATVNNQPLWMRLFSIAEEFAAQTTLDTRALLKKTHDTIHEYFVEH